LHQAGVACFTTRLKLVTFPLNSVTIVQTDPLVS
jgi:hypothetical protein